MRVICSSALSFVVLHQVLPMFWKTMEQSGLLGKEGPLTREGRDFCPPPPVHPSFLSLTRPPLRLRLGATHPLILLGQSQTYSLAQTVCLSLLISPFSSSLSLLLLRLFFLL